MKVKVNVSVFLGVVLCVALMGGMWLMRGKNAAGDAAWNPNRIYNTVGGAQYSSGAFSLSRSEGLDVSVPMSSSRTYHRATPSFASAYNAAASAVASRQSSMPSAQSPISYTSSAANYHSFGGGNVVASGASAGSFRASNNNPGAPASLSVPSMPTYTSARTISASQSEQAAQASSAIVAAAPAVNSYNSPVRYSGGLITSPIYTVGAMNVSSGLSGLGYSIGGRYYSAPGMGDNLDTWLQGLIGDAEKGWMDIDDGSGITYFDEEKLKELYLAAIENGDLPSGITWEQFKSWFETQGSKYDFPIPDGIWFMCALALLYALFVYNKKRNLIKSL